MQIIFITVYSKFTEIPIQQCRYDSNKFQWEWKKYISLLSIIEEEDVLSDLMASAKLQENSRKYTTDLITFEIFLFISTETGSDNL